MLRRTAVTLSLALASTACATLPKEPVQRALYTDLRQVVDTRQRVGWVIDRAEIEDASATALHSVCQVKEEARLDLLDWFDKRIAEEGGPASEAFARTGDKDGDLLTLERMKALLEHADERAAEDCPFWLDPDPAFSGVQTDTDRFIIIAESMGRLSLMFSPDDTFVGAGGAFRIIPAYGVSDRVTLGLGIELGGLGALSDLGEQTQVTARPLGAVPLLVRLHDDTWVFDFEAAPIMQYHDGTVSLPPGVRGAFGLGIGSVRIGSIMPMGLAYISYEFQPAFRDLQRTHAISVGTRVGVNFDP